MPRKDDPRLKAAELTEDEFAGRLIIHPHSGMDFLEAYRDAYPWASLPQQSLIRPQNGYVLHFAPALRSDPLIFLSFNGELVGVFEGDNLTVDSSHQGKHLGRELIRAGFAQTP